MKKPPSFIRQCGLYLALLGATTQIQAQNQMTMMQKAQHASPMPSLMMLLQNNADDLGLDNEQLAVMRKWRHQNMAKSKGLIQEIIELETEMSELALEGMTQEEIQELKRDLLEARGKLIDLKYRCLTTVKETLEEDQWQSLLEIRAKTLRITQDKQSQNEIQAFLRVSPMPKLMAIILMHGAELKLTPEQNKNLIDWRLKHMNHWATLFDQVLTTEKQLTEQAIALRPADAIMEDFNLMAKKRQEMAQMSLNCRDNIRKVLNDHQWTLLINKLNHYRHSK